MNSSISLWSYVLWWCIKISIKQVYLCWCCQMPSTEAFQSKRLIVRAGSMGYLAWVLGHKLVSKSKRMHKTLTPLIAVLFHSSLHNLLTRLKTAGCMLEGWLGVALHILTGNFPCLLMVGWKSMQDTEFMAQVATKFFLLSLHRNRTIRASGSEHLNILVH